VRRVIRIPIPMPAQPPRDPPRLLSAAESLSTRAAALHDAYSTDEALPLAEEAVRLDPTPTTLNNLAVILITLGRFEEAFPFQREAYERDPTDPRMSRLYGEALLRLGRLAEGWPIFVRSTPRYEWMTIPEWQGEPLRDRRLLVINSGGYGDNIYAMRWIADLAASGIRITYLCWPNLASLARTLPVTVVENWNGNVSIDPDAFDFYSTIYDLPLYLRVTYEDYTPRPYLAVRPRPRFHLRRRVGFCWRGGEALSPRYSRSLNWDQRQRILAAFPAAYIDLSDLTGSWLDTAQVIASLDLLVTVDTGVAHLAGALGVPTWVVLPGASAWQYPIARVTHPLYRSMRMFHNRREGLDRAVTDVALRLEDL
jgi:Glycosyltransferase family 9 (heptosyltransferase)/Tetratricopeptide repeat